MEHTITNNEDQKQPTRKSWGYAESFLVAIELIILGFVLEIFMRGQGVHSPHMPYNLYFAAALILILVFIHMIYRHKPIVRWLSSVPCSISAISTYALLVLLLGFIKQEGENQSHWLQLLGLNHVKNSWPFLLIEIYLLVSLGLVVLRRIYSFKIKNIGFLLNHLGLWITLVAAGLGSGDLKRVNMNVLENGDFTNTAVEGNQTMVRMPFSLKLLDFNMELYNPKIGVADGTKGEIIHKHGETLPLIHKGDEIKLIDWHVKVKDYIPNAIKIDSGYTAADKPGSMPAAFVEVENTFTHDTFSGWIASGSLMFDPKFLELKYPNLLFLTEPEPKKFESLIIVQDEKGSMDTIRLEVNKPYKTLGWKLYQISYDTQAGKYSKLSVIEAVRDPWLPVVYTGILLLLAGSVYLFWLGRGIRSDAVTQ